MRWTLTLLMMLTLLTGGALSIGDAVAGPGHAPAVGKAPRPHNPHVVTGMHVRITQGQQNKAREAHKRGEIQSFSIIRRSVTTSYQGRIISTQFVERPAAPIRYVYMFRILGQDGKVMVVHVNAANSNVIRVKGTK